MNDKTERTFEDLNASLQRMAMSLMTLKEMLLEVRESTDGFPEISEEDLKTLTIATGADIQ